MGIIEKRKLVLTKGVTLEDLVDLLTAGGIHKIYYAAFGPWWTHDPADLQVIGQGQTGAGLPCDPLGGVLYQTDNPESFFKRVVANPKGFGTGGVFTFMAAHAKNSRFQDGTPGAAKKWAEYWAAIEEKLAVDPEFDLIGNFNLAALGDLEPYRKEKTND